MAIYTADASNHVNFSATAPQYRFTSSFSFTCWVNLPNDANVKYLFSKYSSGSGLRSYLAYFGNDEKLVFQINYTGELGADHIATATAATSAGVWEHVAGVYDDVANTIGVYKAGAPNGSAAATNSPFNAATQGLYFLAYPSPAAPLMGRASDFRLYNCALTNAEVKTIACGQGKDAILHDLVLRTALLDGPNGQSLSGKTICDHSVYKNHVTATGAPTAYADPFGIALPQIH